MTNDEGRGEYEVVARDVVYLWQSIGQKNSQTNSDRLNRFVVMF